jgi:AcrR family transcriptional regulator
VIVDVAARLLQTGGAGAVTTRAVAAEAGVQAPAIYRLFGDKDGLIDAVAEHAFTTYIAGKHLSEITDDPVADLDAGWDTHIGFGLANPVLFALLADPQRGTRSPAAAAGIDILRVRVHRVAAAGRLRVTEPRAVNMIRAAGTGAVLTLLTVPPEDRDLGLADAVYRAVKHTVITDTPEVPSGGTPAAAVALRADLANVVVLSGAERVLLAEWLDRITEHWTQDPQGRYHTTVASDRVRGPQSDH